MTVHADPSRVQLVPFALFERGDNDRTQFDAVALKELADSIAAQASEHEAVTGQPHMGLTQPVTLRLLPDGRLRLVAGERRTRAIRDVLKWPVIQAFVREMTDKEESSVMLTENTARVDLNPMDEASAYQKRLESGWTIEELVQATGKSKDLIARRCGLLRLHPDVQHLVRHRNMPLGHAEAMGDLDHHRQLIAMRVFQSGKGIPLSTFIRVVSDLYEEQSQDSLFDLELFWREQIKAEAPVFRGKKTQVPVSTDGSLPPVVLAPASTKGENASRVILRHVAHLLRNGYNEQAAVIGSLYESLVQANLLKMPADSIDALADEAEALSRGGQA